MSTISLVKYPKYVLWLVAVPLSGLVISDLTLVWGGRPSLLRFNNLLMFNAEVALWLAIVIGVPYFIFRLAVGHHRVFAVSLLCLYILMFAGMKLAIMKYSGISTSEANTAMDWFLQNNSGADTLTVDPVVKDVYGYYRENQSKGTISNVIAIPSHGRYDYSIRLVDGRKFTVTLWQRDNSIWIHD